MIDVSDIGAFLGLDVGKGEHHATAVTLAGRRTPRGVGKLQAMHGRVLVAVDQPAPIGALPLAAAGHGLADRLSAMRRIADLYPGEAKSDASDGFPHSNRLCGVADACPHVAESWARSVPRPSPQGRTSPAGDVDTPEGAADGRTAGRGHLRRAGRADRRRPGTDAAAMILPSLASSLQAVLDQRKLLAAKIEELLESHPLPRS